MIARKYASALAALAMCAACGGAPAPAPPTASDYQYIGRTLEVNGRPVTAARPPNSLSYTPVVPNARSKSTDFEYIINDYGSYASIFDYPASHRQVGSIAKVGGQGCTNVLHGYGKNVIWIVAAADDITEYGVPKTPLKTLTDSVGSPSSCAMNAGGDLAVGILYNYYGPGGGDVVIYKDARGPGTVHSTPLDKEYFDAYDDRGNLFADGFTSASSFALVELPKGGSTFKTIVTSNTVEFPGSVQWDGTYLTVLDQLTNKLYRYTVSGTTAKLKGTVSLSGSGDCAQTWIVPGRVYCADATNDAGEVFKYPAGGPVIATFAGKFDVPLGTVAAEK